MSNTSNQSIDSRGMNRWERVFAKKEKKIPFR